MREDDTTHPGYPPSTGEVFLGSALVAFINGTNEREGHTLGVCHGDLWENNVLFAGSKDKPDEQQTTAVLLDWQFAYWGSMYPLLSE